MKGKKEKNGSAVLNGAGEVIEQRKRWEKETLKPSLEKLPERDTPFTTVSGVEIKDLYTPADVHDIDFEKEIGWPGEYPYTRGIHPSMYRSKIWTMRQFSGFGSAAQTNERLKYLLSTGTTGLSIAFHLPNLMGRDSDHEYSRGEVGKCGVTVDSLQDMETLFNGIMPDHVTTSMTTNAPAIIMLSMYQANAEKHGVKPRVLSGTIQNDILKEYLAQKTYIYPPRPSMRLVVDSFAYCAKELPRWNSISISGYHIREAGSTAVQELAFTLYDGIEYVKWALDAGMDVDEFAPRLSFFFNAHNDVFEEIAKYRAARKIWTRVMKERFHAKNPRSWLLRFHTQTAGCSLTAQQPYNNVVRVAMQALAAVLGGTQSLHTNSLDETLALPTQEAVTIALRTQQIIAYESGVTNTVDPLAGSYFVERLTKDMEDAAYAYFDRLDAMGGMVNAIEKGYPQKEIADASYEYSRACEKKEKIIVGVNEFAMEEPKALETLYIDESIERDQIERLKELRKTRDNDRVKRALDEVRNVARGTGNMVYPVLDAVKAYATLGEICDAMRDVWGEYREPEIV
ncbi:MAG: methylmalonyl-CoA mutase [Acidobacteria bacterium]|nr:MAG: methylmalonyl-CoA mutase [Acidobacteriota bacterium]